MLVFIPRYRRQCNLIENNHSITLMRHMYVTVIIKILWSLMSLSLWGELSAIAV